MKEELARRLWKPIFSVATAFVDKPDRNRRSARYSLTNRLLSLYMEKGECRLKLARTRAALDVWLGIIDAIMALDIVGNKELYLPLNYNL